MNFTRCGAGARPHESIIKPGCYPEPGREIAVPRLICAAFCRQPSQRMLTGSRTNWLRLATMSASSMIVFTCIIQSTSPCRLSAGEQPLVGIQVEPVAAADSSSFVAESCENLKNAHEDLIKLHRDIMGLGDARRNYGDMLAASEGEIASETVMVESAKAKERYSRLARQAAEMALREYQEGIFNEEKTSAEAELKLAQDDLARVQPQIAQARERLAKIKQTRGGSTSDLVNVWQHESGEIAARLKVKKAKLQIEQAQAKLRILEGYTKGLRVKELQADIEAKKSAELATRAMLNLEMPKLLQLQKSRNFDKIGVLLTDPQKRLMAQLDRAIPLEEKWSDKLGRLEKDGQTGDAVRREVENLTTELQAIIEKAQFDLAAAAIVRLKGTIHREAKAAVLKATGGTSATPIRALAFDERNDPSKASTAIVANPASFVIENRKTMANLEGEFIGLGSRVLAIVEARKPKQVNAVDQQITIESAEMKFENAKLARELAEIAIIEYEEGIFKQDEAVALGVIKLEEAEVRRAADMIEQAKSRLAQIKQVSRGSAADLANEYAYEDRVLESERREPVAQRAVEKARSKLKILQEYTHPKRVKELQANAEKAKADELATRAQLELEKSKLKKMREPTPSRELSIHEQRILTLLDQAIPIEERLQAKLAQAEADQDPGDALRKEVSDLTSQFRRPIERALAEEAAANWERLKPDIHRAASQIASSPAK